jgi:hypothetical protein
MLNHFTNNSVYNVLNQTLLYFSNLIYAARKANNRFCSCILKILSLRNLSKIKSLQVMLTFSELPEIYLTNNFIVKYFYLNSAISYLRINIQSLHSLSFPSTLL